MQLYMKYRITAIISGLITFICVGLLVVMYLINK